jgi:hypothetical protein
MTCPHKDDVSGASRFAPLWRFAAGGGAAVRRAGQRIWQTVLGCLPHAKRQSGTLCLPCNYLFVRDKTLVLTSSWIVASSVGSRLQRTAAMRVSPRR